METVTGLTEQKLTFSFINNRGVRLHVVEAGPPNGPPVILLHGFPEFWRGWKRQIPALAGAGYRVIVPDQRGYNLSDKPGWLVGYRMEALLDDVLGLLRHYGFGQAALVGHDWGAAVAWNFALTYPEQVRRLGILNVPHPAVFRRTLARSPAQWLRSTYAGFFQLPGLPDWLLRRGGAEGMLRASSQPGTFTVEDLRLYRQAWQQPGAMTAMLNWYRAALRYPYKAPRERVTQPALILWGRKDVALKPSMAGESLQYCDQGELIFYNTSHWVQHEAADEVNRELIEFLGG